jgi:phage-related protein
MSSEVFWWEPLPDNRIVSAAFSTIITAFESGYEQRRPKWYKDKMSFRFEFERGETNALDDIYKFFIARKGAYDNFYLPTWMRETHLEATANSSKVYVSSREAFTVTSGIRGNAIFFHKLYDPNKYDVETIDSFGATATVINLDSSPTYTYLKNTPLSVAVKVRFAEDNRDLQYYSRDMFRMSIGFIEDKG